MERAVVGIKVAKSERKGRGIFLKRPGQCFHERNNFYSVGLKFYSFRN